MGYFIKVLKYGKSYKIYGFLNILFNVFYAIFSALAFVSFIPMLDVLFKQTKEVFQKPVYTGITDLKDYLQDYLNYYISRQLEIDVTTTLLIVVGIVLFFFLFKNIFNYLALYNITFLKNGILKILEVIFIKRFLKCPFLSLLIRKKVILSQE